MIKRIVPVIVIAVLGAISWVILQNPPEV